MKRRLGVCAIALSLLGCSAQASVGAKAGQGGAQTAGAEALKPRESNWEKEAREEAAIASRSAPLHETGAVENEGASAESAVPAPVAKSRRGKKHSRAKAKKHNGAEIAAAPDHDRGHGNDLGGVDQDNPGKRKKK